MRGGRRKTGEGRRGGGEEDAPLYVALRGPHTLGCPQFLLWLSNSLAGNWRWRLGAKSTVVSEERAQVGGWVGGAEVAEPQSPGPENRSKDPATRRPGLGNLPGGPDPQLPHTRGRRARSSHSVLTLVSLALLLAALIKINSFLWAMCVPQDWILP